MGLEARFAETARRAGATAPEITLRAVVAELIARWSEPHRHYHHLTHLQAVLDEVEHEPMVALAAWGHDAVYDPRSASNEERSAQLLSSLLTRCGISPTVPARLVRMTANHIADDPLGILLAEADLAILASESYESYVDAVRREYAHVPEDLWRIGRAAVLQNLLDQPALFHLHPEKEAPARANLTRELASLTDASAA